MTAKRFWKYIPDTCNPYGVVIRIVDNETGKQHGTVDEYVDLLNELHEENRLLEIEDERWVKASEHDQEVIDKLRKENEQLKKDIEYYKTERLALFEYIDKKDDLKLELKVEK